MREKHQTEVLAGNQTTRGATSDFDELKRRWFTPEGKTDRMARSLSALRQTLPFQLTTEQWRRIAEDSEIQDN